MVITGNRNQDALLMKTSGTGQLLWYKTFGGSDQDQGESLIINAVGEYVLLGETHSFGLSKSDFFIVKTDKNGNAIWTRHYGGTGYNHGFSIELAVDSGYILAGTTHQSQTSEGEATFIHINEKGDTLWTKKYDTWQANVRSLCRSWDNRYVFTGWEGGLTKKIYFAKLGLTGNIIWKHSIDDLKHWSKAYSVTRTSDKGYFIIGTKEDNFDKKNVVVIKMSSKGHFVW